jgi:hypothetical protein
LSRLATATFIISVVTSTFGVIGWYKIIGERSLHKLGKLLGMDLESQLLFFLVGTPFISLLFALIALARIQASSRRLIGRGLGIASLIVSAVSIGFGLLLTYAILSANA